MLNTRRSLGGAASERRVLAAEYGTRIPAPGTGIRSRTGEIQNSVAEEGFGLCEINGGTQRSSASCVSEVNAGRLGCYVIEIDVSEEDGIGSGH